jgi:hypothetical protein
VNLIALRCSGPIGLCSFVAIRRRQRGQITTGSFGRELVGLKHERRAQCDAGFHAYQMLEESCSRATGSSLIFDHPPARAQRVHRSFLTIPPRTFVCPQDPDYPGGVRVGQ